MKTRMVAKFIGSMVSKYEYSIPENSCLLACLDLIDY